VRDEAVQLEPVAEAKRVGPVPVGAAKVADETGYDVEPGFR